MPSIQRIVGLCVVLLISVAALFYRWDPLPLPEWSLGRLKSSFHWLPLSATSIEFESTANVTLLSRFGKRGHHKHNENQDENQVVTMREWKKTPDGEQPCLVISFYNGNESRRRALRETWLKWTDGSCLKYRFVGDPGRLPHEPKSQPWHPEREKELAEQKIFGDMFFVPGRVGWSTDMTKRTVAFMEYAEDTYDYDYFLMVDTDFFLCYYRLIRELSVAPRTNYAVGKVWCRSEIDTCFDEQFVIMSRDIVRSIVAAKKTVGLNYRCATGQSIVLWTQGTGVRYFHDGRITSQPHNNPAGLKHRINVCEKDIGLHHANVTHIYEIWEKEQKNPSNQIDKEIYQIPPLKSRCPFQLSMVFDACFKP